MNLRRLAAWCIVFTVPCAAQAQFEPGPIRFSGEYPNQFETGIILVSFQNEASEEVRQATHARCRAQSWQLVTPALSHLFRVRVADGEEDQAIERYRRDPAVALVRRNAARYFFGAAGKHRLMMTQTTPYNVSESNAPTLWAMSETGEADGGIRGGLVRIAVIDSGCNAHDDLPTPLAEEDFVDLDQVAADSAGHGTAVAGVALARDNEMCYVGAAPDADFVVARIDPELGGTTIDRSIAAIGWAINVALPDSTEDPKSSVRVINMSYGSSVYDEDEELICNKALADGVVLVAACGNGDESCSLFPKQYPAAFPSVLAVAAVAEGGLRVFETLSMRIATNDLCAGGDIIPVLSSLDPDACGDLQAGTSFASPVVVGVAALLFDQIEEDSTVERKPEIAFLVRQALILGASDGIGGFCSDPAGRDPSYGWGRVDAEGSHLIVSRRLACKADFNLDGVLDSDDLDEFTAAATATPPTPGPGGYAVPASIRRLLSTDDVPDAPYDELGYAADYNQDGKIDPDDISDFVADYYYGC